MKQPGSPVLITFEITLPPNTPPEDQIYLAADFGGWLPGSPAQVFKRSGNQARLTINIPLNLTFKYKYTRGKWSTVETAADGNTLHNRWATVKPGVIIQDNIANWKDRIVKIPQIDPRVKRVTLNSRVLKVPKSLYVYLPPGYDSEANQTTRYPVLYLFRGHEREWVNTLEDHSRGGKTVIDAYLAAYANQTVGPVILVFPGISSDEDSVPGMLVDFKQPELAGGARGIGSGQFETYFMKELIPFVDKTYRTIGSGSHRGVDGFSLGGLAALKIASKFPVEFRSAGSYDGTFFYANSNGESIRNDDPVFRAPIFNPHFGVPRDYAYGAANNPVNLIMNGNSSELSRIRWLVQTGPEAVEPNNSNFYRGTHLLESLAGHNIQNGLEFVLLDGLHNWATADRHMSLTFPLHWQTLRQT